MNIPERYVRLCLRVGRHVGGFIDAYIGPPDWQDAVAADDPVDPARLHDEAMLLLDALDGTELEEDRRRWLRGQLEAVGCVTARLGGEELAWADEVERCLGIRPSRTDSGVLEDIHRRLDSALAGNGSVRERYIAWDERNAVPRERLVASLERLREVLGPRAHALAPMPAEESVAYELVSGKPWVGYNWYQGGYRSGIEINADLPISVVLLLELAAHEAYPGHHTERTAKDALLHRERGRVETSVVIIPSPESLLSEGIGMIALEQALGQEPFDVLADILADMDLGFDPDEAHQVYRADRDLYAAAVNGAFMLHQDGATTEEAEEYLREVALESNERAARSVAFLTDATTRAYISTYPDGWRLCREFADRTPGNFTRLLTEQLTTADLLP